MVRTFIDLINLLFSTSSFFVSLIIFTILAVVLAKSIKKNANIYYWVFGVMSTLYSLPMLFGAFDIDIPFSISSIPVLGTIFSEFSSASYFIHPLLIIIMYMGALSLKTPYVGKLMSIRKELSIIVGFAVIAHATKRVLYTFPRSWNYFVNHDEYMADREISSLLGTTISNFVLFLGIIMTVLFLVLWITSFDSVRRKMGNLKWKKVQRWSYVLYAMLFIHALGLNAGSLVSSYASERIEKMEIAAAAAQSTESTATVSKEEAAPKVEKSKGRPKQFRLGDVEPSRRFRQYFNMSLYILIYGSYLYLRIRKSKRDKLRKVIKKS